MGKSHDKQAGLPQVVVPKNPISKPPKSLNDHILLASNEAEIETLLSQGKAYLHASAKTRRRWHEASQKRRAELVKA